MHTSMTESHNGMPAATAVALPSLAEFAEEAHLARLK